MRHGIRKNNRTYCPDCKVGLCTYECFGEWHAANLPSQYLGKSVTESNKHGINIESELHTRASNHYNYKYEKAFLSCVQNNEGHMVLTRFLASISKGMHVVYLGEVHQPINYPAYLS